MTPLFSIITVCYNAAQTLPDTIASLRAQTWRDYEYVVVDGASSDATLQILDDNADLIDVKVTERDAGIYDAMNKAVGLCCGRYLFFLNADDRFCDAEVLADVAAFLSSHLDADLVYGNIVVRGENGHLDRQSFDWVTHENILYGHLCHQAAFTHRRLFDDYGNFNLKFPINADYDWLLRVFQGKTRVRYLDRDLTVFYAGGRHAQDRGRLQNERKQVRLQYTTPLSLALGDFAFRAKRKLKKMFQSTGGGYG